MTINGTDLSAFGATLLSKTITNHEMVQVYDWLDGAVSPVFFRTEQRFKDITLTVLIESSSGAETEQHFSALILALKDCTLLFPGTEKLYACHFKGKAQPQRLTGRAWLLEIDLLCHKTYSPEVTITANGVSHKIITNIGTIVSPCQIIVTPTVAITEYVIYGLSASEIRIKNLAANKPHTIDGYLYRYLKDGVNDIVNYNAFAWPDLPVGITDVILSHTTANVTIKYYPLFI